VGAVAPSGYGRFYGTVNGVKPKSGWQAHRLIPYLLGYPLGGNMHHVCRIPRCVNPAHLTPISALAHRDHHHKEFCKHGHPLADAYRGTRSNGTRYVICRTCKLESRAAWWRALPPIERAKANAVSSERRRSRKRATPALSGSRILR
jgi:hypothetical protein